MGLDLTSFDAALKAHYTADAVLNMVYKDNPLLALISKMEDFGGKNLPIPLIYGNPQGRSATFARAQSRGASTSSKVEDFVLVRVKDYSIATIDNETLEASKGNANAFMEAATVEIDGCINALTRSIASSLYRSGYGDIGVIAAAGITTTTITLATPADVVNFEVGMELDVSATQTGTARAYGSSGNGLIITGIDRSAGTLSFGANVTDATDGIPLAAPGDYIFVRGDHSGSTRVKLAGLEAWLPASAPAATSFFSVDRTVDSTRLSGLRFNKAGVPIEEALIDAAAKCAREGGKIDHYFMSYEKYSDLEKALGSKVQYVDLMGPADVGFRGMRIQGPKGEIKVVPDQNCPDNRIFGLNLPVWKLYSLGPAVRVIDTDGLQMLRQASADGVEVRYGFYGNLGCRAPGWNVNLQV